MKLSGFTALLCFSLLLAACKDSDDDPKTKNAVDISAEFDYAADLPGDLTFADNKFWVSATASDKVRAFDFNTGRNMTVWAKETQWSQGLDSDGSFLYQISYELNGQSQPTPVISNHSLHGGQWNSYRSLNIPQASIPFDLVYNVADSIFLAGYTDMAGGSQVKFFNPATGALGQELRSGAFSGMTYHNGFVWLAETIRNGSSQTFKIFKISLAGTIVTSYDLHPGDGGQNSGGTVDGIVFKDNELWYLNGALLKIVKSNIKGD